MAKARLLEPSHGRRPCCNARTGTITIAIVWLVLQLANIAVYSWHLHYLADDDEGSNPFRPWWNWFDEEVAKARPDFNYSQIPMVAELRAKIDDAYANHRGCLTTLTWACMAGAVVNAIFSILMLHGSLKNRRRLLTPWLVYNIMGALTGVACGIMLGVWVSINMGAIYGVPIVIELLFAYLVYFFLFRVVWAYWKQLRKQERLAASMEPRFDDVVGLIKA